MILKKEAAILKEILEKATPLVLLLSEDCEHLGFTAISKGLIKVLGEASSMVILKEKLECDLAALTKVLDTQQ